MLNDETVTTARVAAATRLTPQRLLVVRAAAVCIALAAIWFWPRTSLGYGLTFWLWAVSLVVYAASFPRARHAFAPPAPLAIVWLLVIVAFAVALRFPGIESNPANISVDELLPGIEAQKIARGLQPNVFSSLGWFAIPNLSFAFPAVIMKLLSEESFLALRLSSMLMGVATIICVYLLGRRLLNDRAALIASFLMAAGFWHIHNSRTGFPFVQSSFCPALVLYLVIRARQDGSRRLLAVAGICLGLALECYFPARILLVLVPLFLCADWLVQRESVRAIITEGVILAVSMLLALGPMLICEKWVNLSGHSLDVMLTSPAKLAALSQIYHVNGLWPIFARNFVEATHMFTSWADVCVLNRSPGGLLDAGTLAMLLAGILIAVLQGRVYPLLLVAWALLTFVLGVAFTDSPRASYRLAPAMPAIFLLAAWGIDRLMYVTSPPQRWYRYTVRPAIFVALAVWITWQNYRLFFVDYAKGDGHESGWAMVMRALSAHCDGRRFYVLSAPEPLGDAPTLNLFCANHRSLTVEQIPAAIDVTKNATFLVAADTQPGAVAVLRRCYPEAPVTPMQTSDGRLLLYRVDVEVPQLVAGRNTCT